MQLLREYTLERGAVNHKLKGRVSRGQVELLHQGHHSKILTPDFCIVLQAFFHAFVDDGGGVVNDDGGGVVNDDGGGVVNDDGGGSCE